MIDPVRAVDVLRQAGVSLFTGVPDSLLKEINTVIDLTLPASTHIPAPNEGAAVGVAAGHHLATGDVALVYLQNSGLGNAVNPLVSLTSRAVYGIPIVLMIGWRGQPGVPDEPQHLHQGRITEEMLRLLDVPFVRLASDTPDWEQLITTAVTTARERQGPSAILVSAGTFLPAPQRDTATADGGASLTRPEAIGCALDTLGSDVFFVATTGYTARELAALRVSRGEGVERDFLAVGSMGHASAIALGIAQGSTSSRVVCLDGDGSLVMHLGSMAMIGRTGPTNLGHILFNNRVHESVGGQPTVLDRTRVIEVAIASGYRFAKSSGDGVAFQEVLRQASESEGPWLVEVAVRLGTLASLPRPTDLVQRKDLVRARMDDD